MMTPQRNESKGRQVWKRDIKSLLRKLSPRIKSSEGRGDRLLLLNSSLEKKQITRLLDI
jgi:hypothetical protein